MSCRGLNSKCPHCHCTNVHIMDIIILNFILHLDVMFPPTLFSHGINKLASGTRILSWLAKAKQPCKVSASHQYVELKIGEHCQDTWCKPLSILSFLFNVNNVQSIFYPQEFQRTLKQCSSQSFHKGNFLRWCCAQSPDLPCPASLRLAVAKCCWHNLVTWEVHWSWD